MATDLSIARGPLPVQRGPRRIHTKILERDQYNNTGLCAIFIEILTYKPVSGTVVRAARNKNASILIISVTKVSAVLTLGKWPSSDLHQRALS